MTERKIEELLEYMWTTEEETGDIEKNIIEKKTIIEQFGEEYTAKWLDKMEAEDLVKLQNGTVKFSSKGQIHAKMIIRRHRLAERLLHDVLDFSSDKYESSACKFEHFIGDDVVASICILLGHPRTCPHGKAIPRGDCCKKDNKAIKTLIAPLSEMKAGEKGKVVYISTKFHQRLDRVSGIGIMPGAIINVHQKHPTYVIQVGESQVAIDKNIASEIFVRLRHNH